LNLRLYVAHHSQRTNSSVSPAWKNCYTDLITIGCDLPIEFGTPHLSVPEGFRPIFRSSPALDALGGFMSRGQADDLEVGLLIGPNHLNSRGFLHGGVIATLIDVAFGYMLVARSGGLRQVTASMKIDYRSSAVHGEWLDVVLNHVEKTGRKTLVNGRVVCGDRILAEGSVLFVQVRGTQI
jgi:uncharacterized protein (TIGR00369 family)